MARAYDDDLRRKFLAAQERGEAGLRKLAARFGVSYGWAQKVLRQKRRTGQAERVRHRPGPRSRMTPEIADYIRVQVAGRGWPHDRSEQLLVTIFTGMDSSSCGRRAPEYRFPS